MAESVCVARFSGPAAATLDLQAPGATVAPLTRLRKLLPAVVDNVHVVAITLHTHRRDGAWVL